MRITLFWVFELLWNFELERPGYQYITTQYGLAIGSWAWGVTILRPRTR